MLKLVGVVMAGLVGALVGCHASHDQVRGPDGTTDWYSIECKRNQGNCYEEAGDVCPNGYDIADAGGHSGTYVHADQSGVVAVPTYRGHMLIKCKTAAASAQ
jgi:hypothetical protein